MQGKGSVALPGLLEDQDSHVMVTSRLATPLSLFARRVLIGTV